MTLGSGFSYAVYLLVMRIVIWGGVILAGYISDSFIITCMAACIGASLQECEISPERWAEVFPSKDWED